jgi:two-component system sensor histidine kinase YesM
VIVTKVQIKEIKMRDKYWYTILNLNAISRIALMEKAYYSQSCIDNLIQILRYCEYEKDEIIAIDKELDIIEKMFNLYKIRMGKSFKTIILNKIEDKKVYLPRGILIFFVENALEHAFHSTKEEGEIKIIIKEKDNICHIIIQDNGVGFDTTRIEKEPNHFKSYINILNRCSSFGKIDIDSEVFIGTKVHIRVPLDN